MIAWLAVVNTAIAFTLWNHTLRTLSAMESSIINNTMLIQVAILAWLFLSEALTWQRIVGMILASAGAILVQARFSGRQTAPEESLTLVRRWCKMACVLNAFVLWLFAVVGAVGVAYWLRLSLQDALLLIIAVPLVAIVGAFIPALRLGRKS